MFNYRFIGASIGHCAGITGCEHAPDLIKQQLKLEKAWEETLYYRGQEQKIDALNSLNIFSTALANATKKVMHHNYKFITLGGDHSCAIGTWSGVHAITKNFGLLWIDAHMDAHTTKSTPSGNLHGMPTAALMGYGDDRITKVLSQHPKLKPENLFLIGTRSFEEQEKKLLRNLGVKIFMINDVHKHSLQYCFDHAINHFSSKNIPFGISLDLDSLDPQYIKALGTPVENGLLLPELLSCLEKMKKEQLIGIELAEYNPTLDPHHKGIYVIRDIINSITTEKY